MTTIGDKAFQGYLVRALVDGNIDKTEGADLQGRLDTTDPDMATSFEMKVVAGVLINHGPTTAAALKDTASDTNFGTPELRALIGSVADDLSKAQAALARPKAGGVGGQGGASAAKQQPKRETQGGAVAGSKAAAANSTTQPTTSARPAASAQPFRDTPRTKEQPSSGDAPPAAARPGTVQTPTAAE